MVGRNKLAAILCAITAGPGLAGCESPAWTHKLNESFESGSAEESAPRTAEEHRREYAASRNRKSFRWLLAHEAQPGMTYRSICQVIGEEGQREFNDTSLKKTPLRIDDETYGWPDSEGHVQYLFFRDNRLIHFDPEDFR